MLDERVIANLQYQSGVGVALPGRYVDAYCFVGAGVNFGDEDPEMLGVSCRLRDEKSVAAVERQEWFTNFSARCKERQLGQDRSTRSRWPGFLPLTC